MKASIANRTRQPLVLRNRWALLSALLVLLSIPLLTDLRSLVWHSNCSRTRLPVAGSSVRLPDNGDTGAIISIGRKGILRFSCGEEMSLPVSEEELAVAVSNISAERPERPFILYIDRETPYAKVAGVLAAMGKSGPHRIYFRTDQPS